MTRIGLVCVWVVAACNMETSAGPDPDGQPAADALGGGAVATIVVTPASANAVASGVAVNPPVANPNGSLIKTYMYLDANFTWTLQPQTQP